MLCWAIVIAIVTSFVLSFLATPVTRRIAHRFGMLDTPGRHKAHAGPVPLLGGCGIFMAILMPSLLGIAVARVWAAHGVPDWVPQDIAIHIPGLASRASMALGILGGAFVLHLVGIIDDRKNLGPILKLIAQVGVAVTVVLVWDVRILTVAGSAISVIVTVLWIVAITNAFNFLDNMDGLATGVAAICAAALLGASAGVGQLFVSAWLCLILGATLGYLPFNFPPARTFMGDAGSLVLGYLLAVVSCLTTYTQPGQAYYAYGIFVPLVVMAVPLYDMASVITLRIRERRSPMVGDRRHFSHRLVRRGMSVRVALLTIYLCTGATAIGASLLPYVTTTAAAVLVFIQAMAILLIIALLESGNTRT